MRKLKSVATVVGVLLLSWLVMPASLQTVISNNAADMANHIVMVADSTIPRTVTNLFTFDRGAAVPFAVGGTALKVTNLDADKLDGIDSTSFIQVTSALLRQHCGLRLTLTTGLPVTPADVTAATTVYITPYEGGICSFYDGSTSWTALANVETSIALGADAANTNYDVFCYNNSGTMACERLAWSSDTVRATGISLQNGVYVKTGTTTRRYIGTYRTTATIGQTEDSFAKRFVWSYYNRQKRAMRVFEATDSWPYTTATWRQANGSTANQLAVVVGVAEVPLEARVQVGVANTAGGVPLAVSIREDSVGTPAATSTFGQMHTTAAFVAQTFAALATYPAVGYHIYIWQEFSSATGTTTWYGDNASGSIGPNSGIVGWIEG